MPAPLNLTMPKSPNTTAQPVNFDWSLMPSFLAVIDAGSLLGAARQLQQAQPTLGRHIDALESQLGVSLFERTGRGLVPTERALAIAGFARGMQAQADDLSRSLSQLATQTAGTVRITASQTVAAYALPPLLAELRAVAPEIQIELVTSNEVKNLLRREADIAIRMVRPEQSGLIARKIGDVQLGAFAHKRYLKKRGTPQQPADLFSHDLIGFDQDDSMLRGFRNFGVDIDKTAFALRSDDHIVHWQGVRAALGIGFVAKYVGRQDTNVVRVLPTMPLPPLPVWLTSHREIHGNPRIRRVFDFLAERFMLGVTE